MTKLKKLRSGTPGIKSFDRFHDPVHFLVGDFKEERQPEQSAAEVVRYPHVPAHLGKALARW